MTDNWKDTGWRSLDSGLLGVGKAAVENTETGEIKHVCYSTGVFGLGGQTIGEAIANGQFVDDKDDSE